MIDYKKKMTIGKAKKILRGFLAKDCYIETPLYYAIPYLLDYITNLQEELKSANESISWWQNRFNAVEKQNNRLKGENQDIKDTLQDKLDYIGHLKELCDKYEEEHNTKFNEWVFDKRENEKLTQGVTLLTNKLIDMTKEKEDYKSRNKKAIEYINQNKHLSMFADCREPEEEWNYDLEINPRELLNILNGDNK